jgi:hypothetical protein
MTRSAVIDALIDQPTMRREKTARPGLESMGAHQPPDAMQAAGKSFRQHVMPDPPFAIGAGAAFEAVANDPAENGVASRAFALRPGEPGEEPAPQNTERSAHPFDRPLHACVQPHRCFAMKANFTRSALRLNRWRAPPSCAK